MKSKMNIRSIVVMAILGIISLFFINMSLAANTAKVTVETANLRETADANSKILVQLSQNQEIEIVEEAGEWYKVKSNNITGYVRGDLLDVNKDETENTTTVETSSQSQENTNIESQEENTSTEKQEDATEQKEVTETNDKEIELGKQIIGEDTKLKIVPTINATDIIEVKKGEEVEVTEIINDWVCVQTGTAKGWLRKDKIQKEEIKQEETVEEPEEQVEEQPKQSTTKTLYVNTATVNLRKEASTSSEIVTTLPVNTAVEVLLEENGWCKVKVSGKEGYIASTLLSDKKQETSRSSETTRKAETTSTSQATNQNTTTTATATVSGNGSAVVEYAKQFIGIKYVYGGSSPSTGFDCSGFTSYVYKNFGVSLPHSSGGQASVGTAVSKENLALGDLVIYSGHVAIYVGGGQVIHAPRPGKTVCIVPLSQAASNYLGARRVL